MTLYKSYRRPQMSNYADLSDQTKIETLKNMYETQNKSFQDIAIELNTYANKIRRDALKYNIKIRDKSCAQKNALQTGKHKHPTKGTVRDDDTKNKIGLSVLKSWEGLSDDELLSRKSKAKDNWELMSQDDRSNMQKRANDAVRLTSKVGSKLEKFMLDQLLKDGYRVNFHQEQALVTTKLQIDLFIPSISVAIEIDGPSHFLPVWGEGSLAKNKTYDDKKTGLILGRGWVLIRIKQTKDFSKTRALVLYNKLKTILENISKQFPSVDNRLIEIGD